jgi:predicted kinase
MLGPAMTAGMYPLHVVLLAGPPGSGKSSFAAAATAACPHAWAVVSQDALGSRGACVRAMAEALARRQHVLIDRCNFDADQRRPWLELAQWSPLVSGSVSAITFAPNLETCKARVLRRVGHPTLSGPGSGQVVERMASEFVPPHQREGIDHVRWVSNDDPPGGGGGGGSSFAPDVQQLVEWLRSIPPCAPPPRARGAPAHPQLRVATLNILADCWVKPAWYPTTPPAALELSARLALAARLLLEIDADVVCLQEATTASLNGLADMLGEEYTVSALCANEPTSAPVPNGVAFGTRVGCRATLFHLLLILKIEL